MDWSQTFTIIGVLSGFLFYFMSRMEGLMTRMEARMNKLEERMTQIEHDLIEIKTILRLKESCMIKDDRHLKKVE